jgi:hypothetical protein
LKQKIQWLEVLADPRIPVTDAKMLQIYDFLQFPARLGYELWAQNLKALAY